MPFNVQKLVRLSDGHNRVYCYDAGGDNAVAANYFNSLAGEMNVGDLVFTVNEGSATPKAILECTANNGTVVTMTSRKNAQ